MKFIKNKYIETLYDSPLDEYIERYRDFIKNPDERQEQFAKDVFNLVMNNADTSHVTAIAARCGIGKSKIIQSLISYCTQNINFDFRYRDCIGMVIVTDSLERLDGYQEDAKNIEASIWGITDYKKHSQHCAYISSTDEKPIVDQLIASRYKPIVLITTQRYFSMNDEQREMLFSFQLDKDKKNRMRREIVIFDEKPYFFDTKNLTIKNFALCSAALQDGIPCDDTNKDWILHEYWSYRDKMENLLRDKEKRKENVDRFYWKDVNTKNLTSNDNRFFDLIQKHKKSICKIYQDAFTDLQCFKSLMTDGGFFVTQKKQRQQDYQTYFEIYQDNREKFYLGQDKAKFFILDATADIDPDYQCDYVDVIDFSHYNIGLNLKIVQLDVNTSKSQLANHNVDASNIITAICQTIKEHNKFGFGGMLVATYSDIEENFKSNNIRTGHFGNLKGSNSYIDIPKMAHVGLNRYSDFAYFIKYISKHPQTLKQMKSMNEAESRKFIKNMIKLDRGLFVNKDMNEIMLRSILADFEQNIFRTAIRNYNNNKSVCVWTYWNCNTYDALNQMIEDRYSKYGATVEFMGVPFKVEKLKISKRKPAKQKEMTNPQKILDWYNKQPKGREFKISNMLSEISLDNKQYQKAKDNNSVIKNIFDKCRTEKQGYYKVS